MGILHAGLCNEASPGGADVEAEPSGSGKLWAMIFQHARLCDQMSPGRWLSGPKQAGKTQAMVIQHAKLFDKLRPGGVEMPTMVDQAGCGQ